MHKISSEFHLCVSSLQQDDGLNNGMQLARVLSKSAADGRNTDYISDFPHMSPAISGPAPGGPEEASKFGQICGDIRDGNDRMALWAKTAEDRRSELENGTVEGSLRWVVVSVQGGKRTVHTAWNFANGSLAPRTPL